jgi:3-oxoacyl-[acyl-carrier protein] reductase
MDLGLNGRTAFITGASRGIGREIALSLAREGVDLGLFGRDDAMLAETARLVRDVNPKLHVACQHLDLENPAAIAPAVAAVATKLAALDILVNCAGGAYRGLVTDIPDDAWERYFQVKPLGLIRMARECLAWLKRSNQARVINIGGTRGREPARFSAMAGPINMGTLSATKVLANEFGPFGITVNVINPGSTDTGRWDELVRMTAQELGGSAQDAQKHLLREVPMGRVIRASDIADLAVFLASARAGLISGTSINVDGGRTRSI